MFVFDVAHLYICVCILEKKELNAKHTKKKQNKYTVYMFEIR